MVFDITGVMSIIRNVIDLIDAANEYEMSQEQIEELRRTLQGNLDELESHTMVRTASTAFSASEGGFHMRHHTDVAEGHVVGSLESIRDGFTHYRDAVNDTERLAVENDLTQAEYYRALANSPWIADEGTIDQGNNEFDDPYLGGDDG